MVNKNILITGASRGLGLALARALAEDGWTLIITARGAEALEAAREHWKRLKGEGHQLTYWQQNNDGRWVKKA